MAKALFGNEEFAPFGGGNQRELVGPLVAELDATAPMTRGSVPPSAGLATDGTEAAPSPEAEGRPVLVSGAEPLPAGLRRPEAAGAPGAEPATAPALGCNLPAAERIDARAPATPTSDADLSTEPVTPGLRRPQEPDEFVEVDVSIDRLIAEFPAPSPGLRARALLLLREEVDRQIREITGITDFHDLELLGYAGLFDGCRRVTEAEQRRMDAMQSVPPKEELTATRLAEIERTARGPQPYHRGRHWEGRRRGEA